MDLGWTVKRNQKRVSKCAPYGVKVKSHGVKVKYFGASILFWHRQAVRKFNAYFLNTFLGIGTLI